jgi:hypothetical protein
MAINADRRVLEDSTKVANAAAVIYAGAPVALDSNATVVAGSNTTLIYGLAKNDKNSFRDDTFGEFGAFGSGKFGVLVQGIAVVSPSIYSTVNGTTVVNVYDNTKTYNVNDALYCSSSGLITNDGASANGLTNYLGRVNVPPTATNPNMEIRLGKQY